MGRLIAYPVANAVKVVAGKENDFYRASYAYLLERFSHAPRLAMAAVLSVCEPLVSLSPIGVLLAIPMLMIANPMCRWLVPA